MQIMRTKKNVCKDSEKLHFGEYHDMCVQSNILLLVDVFENFWDMCFEINEPDLARFLRGLGLAWQAVLN